jgi:predicted DNA-binding transcriptional regulator AlpA
LSFGDTVTTDTPLVPPTLDRLLSIPQAADHIGITPKTLRAWVKAGKFPAPMRLGREPKVTYRYRMCDLQAYLAKEARNAQ